MTAPKTPTPQGISRLLAKHGFERSTYGKPGVELHETTDGFTVWRTWRHDAPQDRYVAVMHRSRCDDYSDEGYTAWEREVRATLERYAVVIREAGWAAVIRDRGDDVPWLVVTAKEAETDG